VIAAVVRRPARPVPLAGKRTAKPLLANKSAAFDAWKQQVTPLFARLLPGCNVELLLPQAYYFGCREADKLSARRRSARPTTS
jgi:hypothetical protein